MTALFGSSSRDRTSSKNLVEFRAGKMTLNGTTVTPDKRKGQLYVHQSDDSLMHFCWKERNASVAEDDLIIFPDDIEFKRVQQCTTGRVYILKFKSSSRKYFFWMQEPKTDKDEEHCKKINEYLNNPPAPGSNSSSISSSFPGLASLGDQLGDSGLQSLLGNIDRNQLLQMLGMSGLPEGLLDEPATPRLGSSAASRSDASQSRTEEPSSEKQEEPPSGGNSKDGKDSSAKDGKSSAASGDKAAPGQVQLSDLQSILSNLQGAEGQRSQEAIDLSTAFNADALAPLLSDATVQQRLASYLPEVRDLPASADEVKSTIQSPQFKQALSSFSAALQSGQLAPLVQQFHLGPGAVQAASQGDIVAFVKALQAAAEKQGDTSAQIQDDSMNLD